MKKLQDYFKKLFHRHTFKFVEEQVIPGSFINVLDVKNGKLKSSIKDITYRKVRYYECTTCGYISTEFLIKLKGWRTL